ncbi:MAG TPA: hypothetical protein VMG55_00190 [Stellaceae bacterium]|nr:hypothetical protein [Stellaceae bacterium]
MSAATAILAAEAYGCDSRLLAMHQSLPEVATDEPVARQIGIGDRGHPT